MKTIVFLLIAIIGTYAHAGGEWVPYNQPKVMVQEYIVPAPVLAQWSFPQPRYYYEYQLVPQVVMRPVIKTTRRIFFKEETIEQMVPVTEWVYQPVLVYR